jgi:hypothetical protein
VSEGLLELALAELVGQLAGLGCEWKDKAAPNLGADGGPEAWLLLVDTNDKQIGGYEYRQKTNPNNPDALSSFVYGYALRTVTIEAHSFEFDTQPQRVIDRVRWGLRTFTARAVYDRHKIAFVRFGPITRSSSTRQGRRCLDAFADWTFAYVSGGTPNDDPGETIGSVNGGGPIPVDLES